MFWLEVSWCWGRPTVPSASRGERWWERWEGGWRGWGLSRGERRRRWKRWLCKGEAVSKKGLICPGNMVRQEISGNMGVWLLISGKKGVRLEISGKTGVGLEIENTSRPPSIVDNWGVPSFPPSIHCFPFQELIWNWIEVKVIKNWLTQMSPEIRNNFRAVLLLTCCWWWRWGLTGHWLDNITLSFQETGGWIYNGHWTLNSEHHNFIFPRDWRMNLNLEDSHWTLDTEQNTIILSKRINLHLLLLAEIGPHWTLDSTYWVDIISLLFILAALTKRQIDKKKQWPKIELNVVMSGQFCTHAMFYRREIADQRKL